MTTLYKVQIFFKGKKTPESFEKIIDYQFAANATMFWMKRKGKLLESEQRFEEEMVWYPASDIAHIIVNSNKMFDTKREVFEFKRDSLKGVPHGTA